MFLRAKKIVQNEDTKTSWNYRKWQWWMVCTSFVLFLFLLLVWTSSVWYLSFKKLRLSLPGLLSVHIVPKKIPTIFSVLAKLLVTNA